VECQSPGNRIRTLDYEVGKDFVERSWHERSMSEESSVEIQHSQEASDLTDSLGTGTGLKMGHAFGERLGTVG
jgi:hypothetical protein